MQKGDAHQLQGRQVFLPPQVLLHVRADGSQAVVRVHHDMDEGVDQADEERCRIRIEQGNAKTIRQREEINDVEKMLKVRELRTLQDLIQDTVGLKI